MAATNILRREIKTGVKPKSGWEMLSAIPLSEGAVNFFAGMADNLSFGATRVFREFAAIDSPVNQGSAYYSGGEWTGFGLSCAVGVAGGLKAAGAKAAGKEFSHWIPASSIVNSLSKKPPERP